MTLVMFFLHIFVCNEHSYSTEDLNILLACVAALVCDCGDVGCSSLCLSGR